MLHPLILPAVLALAITALLAYFLPRHAERIGLIDVPGGRKQHEGETPVVGGLAMFCGFTFSVLALGRLSPANLSLLCALGLLIVAGVLDDVHDLRARYKFLAQIVAALLMTLWAGQHVSLLGDLFGFGMLGLSYWTVPFTAICVLGVINAINMLDGLDGLAGSICWITLGWLAVAAELSGLDAQLWVALLMMSAVAGFLLFNLRLPWRSRAAVFMGDAGSMMLGLALVWLSVDITQGPGREFPPMAAVWIIALPLADMARVMFLRMARGNSPFLADREHLHHVLLARGWSPNMVVLAMTALSAAGGAIGVGAWSLGVPDWALFYTFIAMLACYCIALRRRDAVVRRKNTD